MHKLLIKVALMRIKSDFSARVFVLMSMENELVLSPDMNFDANFKLDKKSTDIIGPV